MRKFKCQNLTNTGIEIHVDGVRYVMQPKGKSNPGKKQFDHCEMILDHVNSSAVQAYVLCSNPKLKFEEINPTVEKMISPSAVKVPFESTSDKELNRIKKDVAELDSRIQQLKTMQESAIVTVDKKMTVKDNEIMAKIEDNKKVITEALSRLEETNKKMNAWISEMEKAATKSKRSKKSDSLFN